MTMTVQENRNSTLKVSIGMPVYNGEKFIREALDSVLAQTFTDFELVISDNCSSDKTKQICEEYAAKDSRIRYIQQSKNIGAVGNFEYLLNEAKGQFFMWLACDDYLENNAYLSEMMSRALKGFDFCFPNVKLKYENARSETVSSGIMDRFSNCKSIYEYSRQTVFTCSYQVYGLFRRTFLIENYKYIDRCKQLRCYGEGLFVHAVISKSLPAYVPDVSLIYRRHGENTSSVQKKSHLVIDFFKFNYSLIYFYLFETTFSLIQKMSIISSFLYLHMKYLMVILFPKLLNLKQMFTKFSPK